MSIDLEAFEETRRNAVGHLLAQRTAEGRWVGELSSSALATATAVVALTLMDRANGTEEHRELVGGGLRWLVEHQNDDGGWGDTIKSFSNISTTMLCWAALGLAQTDGNVAITENASGLEESGRRAERWLANHAGSLEVPALVEAVTRRYGRDRTFSVPILTMCALAGRLGDPRSRPAWRWVTPLPFELAALPMRWFKWLRLPVVSYALPALIAIGQVRHHHRPTRNPITRLMRNLARRRTLGVLERVQPPNGGFLEATPLTSFVTMSLAACGLADHRVARRGASFLRASARGDGSWAIDTNLATWVTTLSVNALAGGSRLNEHLNEDERRVIRNWLLDQQYTRVHPYTDAEPGGWAWTDLPGGVPDADDTAGALIALANLCGGNGDILARPEGARGDAPPLNDERARTAARAGLGWLRSLQNRDGGMPTFCRGWGALPFDRSSQDITAHFLRAEAAWGQDMNHKAIHYLHSQQRNNGAWLPLWFGNQHHSQEVNPTYGTARVMEAMEENSGSDRAVGWMIGSQNEDGGWGGGEGTPSSIEETALAVEALAVVARRSGDAGIAKPQAAEVAKVEAAIERGVAWLIEHTERGTVFEPSPIGFYFAKLWYYEKLYPVIWTVGALERVRAWLGEREAEASISKDEHDA